MITASVFGDFYDRIAEHELQGLYLVLIGFLLSFAFIRMSTRLMRSPKVPWWPGASSATPASTSTTSSSES